MKYVYIRSSEPGERGLWTVGFYDPKGLWHPESDYDDTEKAAKRVHYLNGGSAEWLNQALNEGDGVSRP